jgi:hypothetical protein
MSQNDGGLTACENCDTHARKKEMKKVRKPDNSVILLCPICQ